MKRAIVTFLVSALAVSLSAAATLYFFLPVNPASFGGLSTNDYLTNVTLVLYSSTNAATPMTNWQAVAAWPASQFLTQGPAGSWWTSAVPSSATAAFYSLQSTNGSGASSPFSYPAVWLPSSPAGVIKIGQ